MNRPNRRQRVYNYPYQRPVTNNAVSAEASGHRMAHAQELGTGGNIDANDDIAICRVRFFNAAAGYGQLDIKVGDQEVVETLDFGGITPYVEVPEGFQRVIIQMVEDPKAVILDKRHPFRNCVDSTIAVINTASGVDLLVIPEMGCRMDSDNACFRFANLSYTSPSVDVLIENGEAVFEDVRYKEVTEYKMAEPGEYNFDVLPTREANNVKLNDVDMITPEQPMEEGGYPQETETAMLYFFEDIEAGKRYTAYMIGNKNFEPPLKVETVEAEE